MIPELKSDDPRISIGCGTYGSPKLLLWSPNESIQIGKYCSIAEEVTIFGGGEHRTDWITTYPLRIAFDHPLAERDGHPATKGPTIIGNDVWIAYRATILSGISIGNGSIVAAGSVVTKSFPDYSIIGGNPAKLIKRRFNYFTRRKLRRLKWWNWQRNEISDNMPFLCSKPCVNITPNIRYL